MQSNMGNMASESSLPEGLGARSIQSCYTSYHKWLQVFALVCLSFQEHLENGKRHQVPRFGEQNHEFCFPVTSGALRETAGTVRTFLGTSLPSIPRVERALLTFPSFLEG